MRTRRDIRTEELVLQSPGLHSTIERQCLKTESVMLGERLVRVTARYRIQGNEWRQYLKIRVV